MWVGSNFFSYQTWVQLIISFEKLESRFKENKKNQMQMLALENAAVERKASGGGLEQS